MLKNIILIIIMAFLPNWVIFCYAADDVTPSTPIVLDPSPIQANASVVIPILESTMNSYLQSAETQNLEYGLNLTINGESISQTPSIEYLTNYNRYYCNPNSRYDTRLPESCPANNDNTNINLYGDLRASILFDSLNYANSDRAGSSHGSYPAGTYLSTVQSAINSIIQPFPDATLPSLLSSGNTSDPKIQEQIATLIAKQAPLMMAKNSLNAIVARRILPDSSQRPALPANFTQTIMQIIQGECERRLTDSTWFGKLAQYSTNQLLTELLEIEAFKLWMEYNKFQQNERVEALLATLVAIQAGNNVLSGISQSTKNTLVNQLNNSTEETQRLQNNLPNIPQQPTQ